jgi:hypothetical protein
VKIWWFSLLMLAAYLGIFHYWTALPEAPPVLLEFGSATIPVSASPFQISGLVWVVVFLAIMAANRNYFCNRYDMMWHGLVVLDIVFEAIFVVTHDHYGFYLCAIAFATTVGGYRAWALKKLAEREPRTSSETDLGAESL